MITTKEIGNIGENAATKFLKKCGYRIISRNKHISHNEIDIIAENKEYIVFVEVKTRTANPEIYSLYGTPATSVTKAKQSRLITAANVYLSQNHTIKQPRMDVMEIWLDEEKRILKINHIENAYGQR